MSSWTNAFDLGVCTVKLSDVTGGFPGTEVFSQVMGKGSTKSGAHVNNTVTAYQLDVDAAGIVRLSFDGEPGNAGAMYSVDVIPSYPHDYPARMTGVATYVGGGGGGDN